MYFCYNFKVTRMRTSLESFYFRISPQHTKPKTCGICFT